MGTCTDAKASIGQVDVVESQQERREACQANVEAGEGILVPRKSADGQANGNGPAVRHRVLGMQPNSAKTLPNSRDRDQDRYSSYAQHVKGRMETAQPVAIAEGSSTKNSGENWRLSGSQVTVFLPGGSGTPLGVLKVLAP